MRKNYHAYTATNPVFPAYISVNEEIGGQISVSVRAQGQSTPSTIYLTPEQLGQLAADIMEKLKEGVGSPANMLCEEN